MNYLRFFAKVEFLARPLIYLATFGIFLFVIWQNLKPNVSFIYQFPKMPVIHAYGPVDKFNKSYPFFVSEGETFLVISRAQAFFEITLPGEFERISFEMVHQNQNQLELNLQVPKTGRRSSKALAAEGEELLRLPLFNSILQQAGNWNSVNGEGGWLLLQRPEPQVLQYGSIEKFLQKPPLDRKILAFEDINSQFASWVKIDNLKIEEYSETTSLQHIDYILARYDLPVQIGRFLISNYTVDMPQELHHRGALYKFHLEAYGGEGSKSLVKAIKITLHRPGGIIWGLLKVLRK